VSASVARVQRVSAPLAIALSAAIFMAWEVAHRGTLAYNTAIYPMDPADEWRYTACSRLVNHGYALFSQVYSAQPPLLFLSLSSGMRLFGDSIAGARWTVIGFGLLALLASISISALLSGRLAAAITGLVLSISPGFLAYGHAIEAEIPMMALGSCALALALLSARRQSLLWALLAGLVLAAAVLTKLFALELAAPAMAAFAAQSRSPWRYHLRAAFSLLAGLAIPVALDFGLLSPPQQWQQVVQLHDRAAQAALPGLLAPGNVIGRFLTLDPGLSLLGILGLLAVLAARRRYEAMFLILWFPGTLVMLLLFRPLFPHHAAILATPLAVSAGVGLAALVTPARPAALTGPAIAIAIVAAVLYCGLLPRTLHADRHLVAGPAPITHPQLLAWTREHTSIGQLIAIDDLQVVDLAGRLSVPPLCDPSNVRLKSGYLTAADLIAASRRYQPHVVASTGVFTQVPRYMAWLRAHYRRLEIAPGQEVFISR
jgi:4-amino-4-deoxy-L-arabinose transferase-like glycosyltransferase